MRTRALALSTVAAMTAGALSVPTAGAVSYPSAGSVPIAQLDITQVDGGVAYVFATPELQSHIETVTRQLHELRAKAWDANLPFAGARLRDVAPDRTAYINGISWSRGLEHSAIQRAAEENYDFDHRRGDGGEPWTVKSGAFFAETSLLHRWNAPLLTGLLMAVLAASGISSFALTVPILAVRDIFTACLTQPTTNLPRHRLEARRPAIIPSTRCRAPQSASKDGTHFPLRYRKPLWQARL